jgi:Kef-type K+ transport system membrane component KefB
VTERALHLAAFNCLCALLAFKSVVGFWTFETSGDLLKALSNSAILLLVSGGLGAAFASAMPLVLRAIGRGGGDASLAFALAVILLVAASQALRFSPVAACLAFGLVARHRRVALNQAQRNFGVLGDLLVVFLFTYIAAATVDLQRLVAGAALGAALVVVRAASKIVAVTLLARPAGTTWKKGMLTAVAMSPLSTFAVLLVGDTRVVGVDLMDAIAPIATATLLLLWAGPLATQVALQLAGEVQERARPSSRSP